MRTSVDTLAVTLSLRMPAAEEQTLLRRALISPVVPWIGLPVFALMFWVIESLLHAYVFGRGNLVEHLLSPAPHEAWMRAVVVVMIAGIAWAWSRALTIRQESLAQLRAYQTQLSAAALRIAYGEGEERRQIADRLHEHVGQTLSAGRFFLASIECDSNESDRKAIHSVERILDRAIADCRDIAAELSPPALDEYGLGAALETLADRVMRQTGTSVQVEGVQYAPHLARKVLLTTFQVLAEIVECAAATSEGDSVCISGRWDDCTLDVSIACPALALVDLHGASERISLIGGSLLRTTSEGGPEVVVRAPLADRPCPSR